MYKPFWKTSGEVSLVIALTRLEISATRIAFLGQKPYFCEGVFYKWQHGCIIVMMVWNNFFSYRKQSLQN